jgi:glycosyltransferase involved in cell wall biosynthesis
LLGFINTENQTAIPSKTIRDWEEEGVVTYLGSPVDVRPFIIEADCMVLPSYREGLPIALLEAASMTRPIITTNTVGCRDVVEDGVNGYLVNVRDALDLANKMERMLSLSRFELFEMGQNGRKKVQCNFDDNIIVARYMDELKCFSDAHGE